MVSVHSYLHSHRSIIDASRRFGWLVYPRQSRAKTSFLESLKHESIPYSYCTHQIKSNRAIDRVKLIAIEIDGTTEEGGRLFDYQDPEEVDDLEAVLEEREVDEEEDEGGAAEPEVAVADLHQRDPLDHRVPLRDVDRHPADDPLQLRAHQQDDLPPSTSIKPSTNVCIPTGAS